MKGKQTDSLDCELDTPRVFSYIRFSSIEQEKGDSEGRQYRKAREYAEKKNMVFDTS